MDSTEEQTVGSTPPMESALVRNTKVEPLSETAVDASCTRLLEPGQDKMSMRDDGGSFSTQEDSSPLDSSLIVGSFTMEELEEAISESPFAYLPNEVTVGIFRELDVCDLKAAFLVCRIWSMERCNEQLWKVVVARKFGVWMPLKPAGMTWKMLALACEEDSPSEDARLGRITVTGIQMHTSGEFVGQLCQGVPHGLGAMRYEAGHVYTGTFDMGKRQGSGEYRWKNGNVYHGEWDDDKQNGLGEFRWNDGDYYKGEWKADHRHGKGTYTWPKGSYYEGEFDMNDLHRYGRYTWKNGYYEGGWRNSTRHGKGVIRWTNGNSFDGEFANNAKCGHGVYRWSDGATYSGTWEADDRFGEAVTVWANGMSYVGHYQRDLRNGQGVLRWPDQASFRGTWRNGGRCGLGVYKAGPESAEQKQLWHEEEKIQYSKGIPAKFPLK